MRKVVLITGGGSNLGSAIAKKFIGAGFVIYAPTHKELNVESDMDCQKYVRKIHRNQGKIDILVNCAGVTPVGPVIDALAADYLRTLNINAVGAFRLIKEVVPYMAREGKIININSLNGVSSLPNYGIYSASKHALEAMSFALRQELRSKDLWVTSIVSGAILNEKKKSLKLKRRTAREKFAVLRFLMPFLTAKSASESVLQVALQKQPPARVVLGSDVKIVMFLMKVLPFSFWDKLVSYVWNHK